MILIIKTISSIECLFFFMDQFPNYSRFNVSIVLLFENTSKYSRLSLPCWYRHQAKSDSPASVTPARPASPVALSLQKYILYTCTYILISNVYDTMKPRRRCLMGK
jgi:hypothetical protein